MAKKNNNEDPEEEKDDQFDDDEDFGLPDLEYEELDDDEGGDDVETEETEEIPEEIEEAPSAKKEEEEPENETPEDETVDLPDEEDLNVDDIDDSETEDWEKELEKELEEELKAGGSADEPVGYYEEESYEEFETSDVGEHAPEPAATPAAKPTPGAAYAADTYSSRSGKVPPPRYASTYEGDGSKGKFARTVIIGTLAFALIAVIFLLLYNGDETVDPKPVTDKVAKTAPPKKVEEKPVEKAPVEKPPVTQPVKAQPNPVTPGEITTLAQQTGKTYIVVGSFFDGDQASDFAQKLAKDGKSPMIIPPFRDYRFYRVSIAEFDTFKDAQANIESYKSEFGQDVWPLRY